MINIQKNKINNVVFTLTEKESNYFIQPSKIYNMTLDNRQTLVSYSGITIEDISTNVKRFNQFSINYIDDISGTTFSGLTDEYFYYDSISSITYIFNIESGWYNYSVYDNSSKLLEIGKLLIDRDDIVNTVFTNDENIIIFKP